jgi:glycerol-3-phosphate O-acyltransferase
MEQPACRDPDFVVRAGALVRFLRRRGVRLTASLERNAEAEFRENLAFLESGGLAQRLSGMGGDAIQVPTEKRLALDFYKNNTIHFFLLAALLVDAQSRGLRGEAADRDVGWWLDLFRWEFALPERDELGAEIRSLREALDAEGVLDSTGNVQIEHPFVPTATGILDNFREAYWVVAQLLCESSGDGMAQKLFVDRAQKQYRTAVLLGELRKPEGASSVTIVNALSRFAEIECVEIRGERSRDRTLWRGKRFDDLGEIVRRLAQSVGERSVAVAQGSEVADHRGG